MQDAIIEGNTAQNNADAAAVDAGGDGDGEWVTPENLMEDTLATLREIKDAVPVAICTADYSMQNVVMADEPAISLSAGSHKGDQEVCRKMFGMSSHQSNISFCLL